MKKVGKIIEISHGGGGKRMDVLIKFFLEQLQQKHVASVPIGAEHGDDGAFITFNSSIDKLIISTDSHTISPLFFKGGNIGDLSIAGTVNDVVVMGARPLYLSLGVVIEEGFDVSQLGTIFETIGNRLEETDVKIVTGDTKVMPKGSLEGMITNTTGIGLLQREYPLANSNAKVGDAVIITGTIGDHGASLMSQREGMELDTDLISDVYPFWPYFAKVISDEHVHSMTDITRGGLASGLNDIARASNVLIEIEETKIPIKEQTQAVCDILGLEVMEISSEGKAVVVVDKDHADKILVELHKHDLSKDASIVGHIKLDPAGEVHVITEIGGTRLLDKPYGEPIPRVC